VQVAPPSEKVLVHDSAPLVLTPIRALPEEPVAGKGEQPSPGDAASGLVQAQEDGKQEQTRESSRRSGSARVSADEGSSRPSSNGTERKSAGRLATPVVVDGTPLIPEPGF
jgi:hypothetical protein